MTFTTYLKSLDTRSITHFVLFVKSILTSSPHSVTVTTFPDISIRLSVLLDTSRLDLVVRRDMSSTLLHTPITSEKRIYKAESICFSIPHPCDSQPTAELQVSSTKHKNNNTQTNKYCVWFVFSPYTITSTHRSFHVPQLTAQIGSWRFIQDVRGQHARNLHP